MKAVLQQLGLSVAAQSSAGHEASTPVVPLPAEPLSASSHDSIAERIPDAIQQLMINSFFNEEESRERRAEQARVAAAVRFAPTPAACAPTVICGVATSSDAGPSMSPCEDGSLALFHATGVVGNVQDPATGAMGPRRMLQSTPSEAAASKPATGVNQVTAPKGGSNRYGHGRDDSSGCHGGHRTGRATAVEPVVELSKLLPYTQYTQSSGAFVFLWMLSVVARWPQAVASAKRRRLNADGADCSGAVENSTEGTNATAKTWMTRIRTACAFANFLGRTVCIHPGDARPADAEIERGVRKLFTCMTPFTKLPIICFLKCRRAGFSIAGSDQILSATTLKDYMSGLVYLFAEAKLDGPLGVVPLVKDCAERTSPWQRKGVAVIKEEEKVRAEPGTFFGNPMATADVKNLCGATNKEARQGGEQSLSSAPVTPAIMEAFHAELLLTHLPAHPPEVAGAAPSATQSDAPSAAQPISLKEKAARMSMYSPPSVGQADMLTYIYYVVAFVTLARPVTINFLTVDDVTFPDIKLAENFEFFQI